MRQSRIRARFDELPGRDRRYWAAHEVTRPALEAAIADSRASMRNDLWVGIPWVVLYLGAHYFYGLTGFTIALFFIGLVYFIYAFVRNGTYGHNRKRIRVYESVLKDFF